MAVTALVAGGLTAAPFATAFYAGGGKDAVKGNDCLIGYGGIDPNHVTVDDTGKSTLTCMDCDPSCDKDGAGGANGSCLIEVGVCINQSGVEGCTPPAGLDKVRAKGKVKGVKGGAGKIVIDVPQLLEGPACSEPDDVTMPLKNTKKKGLQERQGWISLQASVKKDKTEGTPKRRDRDKLTIVCAPLLAGQSCPTTTTSTSSTTTTTLPTGLSFRTGEPTDQCGAVKDGGANGNVRKVLHCGGLNVGGGNSTVAEGPTPANAETQMNIDCTGTTCVVSGRTSAKTGSAFNCSDTGCPFGPWLPISNAGTSTCVRNTFSSPASGTLDLSTGSFVGAFPLSSTVYLTANASLPCPLCLDGTPGLANSGTCQTAGEWTAGGGASPDAGNPCTPVNAQGNTHDCGPPPGVQVGDPFPVNLDPLTTGAASFSDPAGLFCPLQATAGAFGCAGTGSPNAICPGGSTPPVPDYIEEVGSDAGPLTPGQPAAAILASVFCIPSVGFVIDAAANLPGPGATSLPGTFTLIP